MYIKTEKYNCSSMPFLVVLARKRGWSRFGTIFSCHVKFWFRFKVMEPFSQVLFRFLIAKAICGAASLHTFIGCCPLTLLKRLLASNYTITYVFLFYLKEIVETHFTNT